MSQFVSDVKKKLKGVNKMIKNTKIDRKRVVSLDSDDCEDSDQPKTKRLKKYQDNNNVRLIFHRKCNLFQCLSAHNFDRSVRSLLRKSNEKFDKEN